jgi:hypothetical protein
MHFQLAQSAHNQVSYLTDFTSILVVHALNVHCEVSGGGRHHGHFKAGLSTDGLNAHILQRMLYKTKDNSEVHKLCLISLPSPAKDMQGQGYKYISYIKTYRHSSRTINFCTIMTQFSDCSRAKNYHCTNLVILSALSGHKAPARDFSLKATPVGALICIRAVNSKRVPAGNKKFKSSSTEQNVAL